MSIWSKIEKKVSDVADEILSDDYDLKTIEAEKHLKNGEPAKALSLLQNTKDSDSQSKNVLLLLAKCYLATDASATALDVLYKLVSKHKEHAEAYSLIAEVQYKEHRFEPAIEATQNAIRFDRAASHPTLNSRLLRGKIFLLENRPIAALKEFTQAYTQDESDQTLKGYCSLSKIFSGSYSQNDFTNLFDPKRESTSDFFIAIGRSKAYLDQEKFEEALASAHVAKSLNKMRSYWPHLLESQAFRKLKRHHEALTAIEAAVVHAPALSSLKHLAADIAFDAKEYTKSSRLFLYSADAHHEPPRFERAFLSFIKSGEQTSAFESLLDAASPHCHRTTLSLWRAYVLHAKDEKVEALKMLSEFSPDDLNKESKGWLAFIRALVSKENDTQKAIESLKEASLIFSDNPYFCDEFTSLASAAAKELTADYQRSNVFVTLEKVCSIFPSLSSLKRQSNVSTKLSRMPLTIAVMGEFSVGKSTLINTILGEDIAQTGVKPTTETFTCYSSQPIDDPDDVLNFRVSKIGSIKNFNIIDTPGLNSGTQGHSTNALDALQYSDVILWMFSSTQAGTKSEFEAIKKISKRGYTVLKSF